MIRRHPLLLVLIVIATCAVLVLGYRQWQAAALPVNTPALESESRDTGPADPLARINQLSPEDAGRYIMSLGSAPAAGVFIGHVAILESVARDYAASNRSMFLARNAVMAASTAYLLTPRVDPASVRLKALLLDASSSDAPRMQSTFLAACQASPELLKDADLKAAVKRLAKSEQDTLDISERATSLLATSPNDAPTDLQVGG